jgi:hypothetical protein
MRWTVQHAAVRKYTEEEAGLAYLSVVLAEKPSARGRYIEFQLALDEDEREEGYCVVDTAPPSYDGDPITLALEAATHKTLYGGVKECRLDKSTLTFRFSWKAHRTFRWPRTLTLKLQLPADQRDALPPALVQVFASAPPGELPPRVLL